MRNMYLFIAIAGAIATYVLLGMFFAQNGWDFNRLIASLGEGGGLIVTVDVLISSVLLWMFMSQDASSSGVKRRWIYVVLNLTVGLFCALGMYLYAREGASRKIATVRANP